MVYKILNSIDLDSKHEQGQAVRRLWLASRQPLQQVARKFKFFGVCPTEN